MNPERVLHLLSNKPASEIALSPEYISFRGTVPQRKVIVDDDGSKVWTYYDHGPRNISCPLVCLPPISGTADVFFKQILTLTARGYRVISVWSPVNQHIAHIILEIGPRSAREPVMETRDWLLLFQEL